MMRWPNFGSYWTKSATWNILVPSARIQLAQIKHSCYGKMTQNCSLIHFELDGNYFGKIKKTHWVPMRHSLAYYIFSRYNYSPPCALLFLKKQKYSNPKYLELATQHISTNNHFAHQRLKPRNAISFAARSFLWNIWETVQTGRKKQYFYFYFIKILINW